jgi:TP901 family phage tail tape measure protein
MAKGITLPITVVPTIDVARLAQELAAALKTVSASSKGIRVIDSGHVAQESQAAARSLTAVRREADGIASATGKGRDEMGRFQKTVQDTEKSAGSFSKAFQFNQVSQLVKEASSAIAELSQPFIALDTATAQMRALGDEAARMAPALREAAIVMSRELPVSAAELQQTMTDALASGVKGGQAGLQAFAETAAKLATGGGSSIADATTVLAGNLNAYGLEADSASKVSDILFNTVNAGVTTIQDLASNLSNVIPTAAGAKIELDSIGGALALMTQKGIPTAQSTTKLNALLIELQKPAASLAPILEKAGVSLESIASDDLVTTLEKVKSGIDATGKSAVQVFGSSEAAAAFQSLAGDIDGFRQAFEDVSTTSGSTADAFAQMSASIQVQSQGMLASVQSFVIEGLDAVGPAFLGVVQSGTQIAPLVTSLSGLKTLLPIDTAVKFGKSLATGVLPALESLGIVKLKNAIATTADAGAEAADAVAKGVNTGVTEAQTVAQYSLNAAFLASPLGIISALAVAGGIAYALLSSSTKELGDATTDASAAMESFRAAVKVDQQAQQQAVELQNLAAEYDQLQASQTALAAVGGPTSLVQGQLAVVTSQMAKAVPEATDAVQGLTAAGESQSGQFKINTAVFNEYVRATVEGAKLAKQESLSQLTNESQALGASLQEALDTREKLQKSKTKFQEEVASGLGGLGSSELFGNPFDSIKDDLTETTKSISEQNKLINEATPKIQEQVNAFQQEGFTTAQIAENLHASVKDLRELGITFKDGLVPSEALSDAIATLSPDAQRAVVSSSNLGKAFQDAEAKVAAVRVQMEDAKFGGDEDFQKKLADDLAAAQKVADDAKIEFQASVDTVEFKNAVKALPKESQAVIAPITVQAKVIADEKGFAAVQQSAGKLTREIVELQKQQGAATDENTKKQLDPQIAAKQQEQVEAFRAQAEQIGANTARLEQLKSTKTDAMSPAETARLRGEMASLEAKTLDASKKFLLAQKAAQSVGATKGDIRALAGSFGEGSTAAKGTAAAMKLVAQETKGAADEAAALADEFSNARASAQSTLTSLKGELAGILARSRATQDAVEKQALDALFKRKLDEAKVTVRSLIESDKLIKDVDAALGVQSLADLDRKRKEAEDRAKKEREDRRKRLADQKAFNEKLRQQQAEASIASINDEFTRAIAEIEAKKATARAIADAGERRLELGRIEIERDAVLRKFRGQGALELLALKAQLGQQEVEQDRATADSITEQGVDAIRDRTTLLRRALEAEAEAKLSTIIAGSTTVQSVAAVRLKAEAENELALREEAARALIALEKKTFDLRKEVSGKPPLSDEEITRQTADLQAAYNQANERLAVAQTTLATSVGSFRSQVIAAINAPTDEERNTLLTALGFPDLTGDGEVAQRARETVRVLTGELAGVQRKVGADVLSLVTKSETDIQQIIADIRLSGITDTAEKERGRRIAEAAKTRDTEKALADAALLDIEALRTRGEITEAEAAQLHDAQLDRRLAADAQFHADSIAAEAGFARDKQDMLRRSNELVRVSVALEVASREFGRAAVSEADRQQLTDKLSLLEDEDARLEQSFKDGLIRKDQYLDRVRQNAEDERQIHAQLEQDKFDISVASAQLLAAVAKDIETQKTADVEATLAKLQEFSLAGLTFSAEAGKLQLDLLADIGIKTAAQMAGAVATVLIQGGDALEAMKKVALRAIFDLAKSQITILAPSIIGMFSSFIPPPFGTIAGTAAVAVLQASLGALEGVLFRGHGGDIAPHLSPGLGDVVPVMATPREFMVNAYDAQREHDLLEWINRGNSARDFLFDRYGHTFVDEQGRLMIGRMDARLASQDAMIHSLGQRIEDGFKSLADAQDRVAHQFEDRRYTYVEGALRVEGSDLVAALHEQQRIESHR